MAPTTARASILASLPSLTLEELCVAWRQSSASLTRFQVAGDVIGQTHLIVLRELCLDELERRDREGFARWLERDAWCTNDPSRYLGR